MIKAVVFQSNAGHSRKYAELFAAKSGLPCYTLDEARKFISVGSEIVFIGWLMAGVLKGYEKAAKTYVVKAVCSVGMQDNNDKVIKEIARKHHIKDTPIFYLRGGIDVTQLRGLYKMMINTVISGVNKAAAKPDAKAEDIESARMFADARNYVTEENLETLLEWYHEQNLAKTD
jgi:hypothetical protein